MQWYEAFPCASTKPSSDLRAPLAVDAAAAAAAAAAIAGGIQHRAATLTRSSSRSRHLQEVAAVALFAMASAVVALAVSPTSLVAVATRWQRGGWTRPLTCL